MRRIASVSATRIGDGMLADLYRLDLDHLPGSTGPGSVIGKLQSSLPQARQLCAAYRFYEREVCFYQALAPSLGESVPRSYYSAFDGATGHAVILMENLAPAESADQIGGISLPQLTAAVDAAATFLGKWWPSPALAELRGIIPTLKEPPYPPCLNCFARRCRRLWRGCRPSAATTCAAWRSSWNASSNACRTLWLRSR